MTAATSEITPQIKGRLRRRPPQPILRARAILYGNISVVLIVMTALLLAFLIFHSQAAGFGTLPSKPGLLLQIWPAYLVGVLSYLATRGFRDKRWWALGLAAAIGLLETIGGVVLVTVVAAAPDLAKANKNAPFLVDVFAFVLLVLGVPLLWNLFRGLSWFTDRAMASEIKTATEIEAETGGIAELVDLVPTDAGSSASPAATSPAATSEAAQARGPIMGQMPGTVAAGAAMGEPLVSVRGLKKHFPILGGVLRRQIGTIYAVDGVDFDVFRGEVFSVVGESGCGKTTLGRTLLQLTPPTAGNVIFDGYELSDVDPDDMRPLRRRMQIIFQDPFGSLNPRMPISDIIGEGLLAQGLTNRKERDKRVEDSLELVGLRRDYTRRYPHEFSGGQRQRIGVARALALSPDFIVCDEPVSALDVSIQSQVLNLLLDLKREFNLTYFFISHNLSVVEYFSDRIAVMYLGKVVELGTVDELYRNARHPYTVALLSAIPIADPRRRRRRLVLKGDVPSPAAPPSGCRFHTRCWLYEQLGKPERCTTEDPELRVIDEADHRAACHFAEEISETAVRQTVSTQDVVETAAAVEA
jgi:oligopeptide/dipeptide ABC transporter ATP-binding protein